jgi:hypothetical protein
MARPDIRLHPVSAVVPPRTCPRNQCGFVVASRSLPACPAFKVFLYFPPVLCGQYFRSFGHPISENIVLLSVSNTVYSTCLFENKIESQSSKVPQWLNLLYIARFALGDILLICSPVSALQAEEGTERPYAHFLGPHSRGIISVSL